MQLFLNFISNALKFTPNGGEITVKLEANEHMIVESKKNYDRIRKNTLHEFKALSLTEQKQHLCELLDKNQLYVNLSSLNDADFTCNEEEKKVTKDFYQLKK